MITAENVKDLFDYRDGKLIRKHGRYSGVVKGTKTKAGYLVFRSGKNNTYYYHRVVWLWHNGGWPVHQIDHIDQDKTNNSIENLRDVTQSVNNYNRPMMSDNRSGTNGVSWRKGRQRWVVYMGKDYVGSFAQFDDAVSARQQAELRP